MDVLGDANSQWAIRPPDERFWTLADLHQATTTYKNEATVARVNSANLRVEADSGAIRLVGKAGIPAALTNYSFGQLSRLADAPPSYLGTLPATLAAQNLNYGLAKRPPSDLSFLFRVNGKVELRAATSDRYERIWNADVTDRLQALGEQGWKVPPAMPAPVDGVATRIATAEDTGEYTLVKPGQAISPSGLYASDRDMFVFLIHPERVVNAGGDRKLFRGFFLWNSEVGDKSFGISTFLFDCVCFNHNVWGAERLADLRIRHIGDASSRWIAELTTGLREYADASALDDEHRITQARRFVIGGTKDEVLDKLFSIKALGLSRTTLAEGYTRAEINADAYGDPNSAWGMSQGLTEVAQKRPHTDARVAIDRAAGKIVEMAF